MGFFFISASQNDRANDNPALSYTQHTSQLSGKRLTLAYVPATQADADLIASYLPKPHADGSPILPSELPTSLPGYLIQLKPQLTLDGQIVATASQAFTMGLDVYSAGGYTQLADASQWDITPEDSNTVGNATAIGLSIQGISAAQLNQLKTRLEQTKTQLQTQTQAQNFTGLSGEQVSGDLLTATLWSWFAAAESHNRLSQNQANMVEMPGLSYGLFHAVANPVFNWGVVTKVTFPGVNMDIGHVRNPSWSKSNDESQWVNYNRLRGQYMSALEHAVPERFFSDPAQCNLATSTTPNPALPNCPQGISAVKALQIAAQAGQRIYTITPEVFQNNPNIVSSQLNQHSADTQSRVQNYLQAGYEVNIHQSPITQDGWSGAGFIVIDQATGAGAYLIEGGSNGGFFLLAAFVFALLGVGSLYLFGASIFGLWMVFAVLGAAGHFLKASGLSADYGAFLDYGGLALAALAVPGLTGVALAVALIGLAFAIITVVRNLWIISNGG